MTFTNFAKINILLLLGIIGVIIYCMLIFKSLRLFELDLNNIKSVVSTYKKQQDDFMNNVNMNKQHTNKIVNEDARSETDSVDMNDIQEMMSRINQGDEGKQKSQQETVSSTNAQIVGQNPKEQKQEGKEKEDEEQDEEQEEVEEQEVEEVEEQKPKEQQEQEMQQPKEQNEQMQEMNPVKGKEELSNMKIESLRTYMKSIGIVNVRGTKQELVDRVCNSQ